MKFHLSITKALVSTLFVFGFVVPAIAEHTPITHPAVNQHIVDWSDEFEQTSQSNAMKTDFSEPEPIMEYTSKHMPTAHEGPVVDWWDEFEYHSSQKPESETAMTSKVATSPDLLDEYWDWESWQSM